MKQSHIALISFFSTLIPGILILKLLDTQSVSVMGNGTSDVEIPQITAEETMNALSLELQDMSIEARLKIKEADDSSINISDIQPMEPEAPKIIWREHLIVKGQNMGQILQNYNLPIQPILLAASPIMDLAKIRIGRVLKFGYLLGEGEPHIIHYPLGEDDTLIVSKNEESWTSEKMSTSYETKESTRSLHIQTSLWAAGIEANLRPVDIANLAQVLEYDVDFNTELHPGDSGTILVEELWKDGVFVKVGDIQAIRFQTREQSYIAIRHDNENGVPEYYSPEGIAREKIFLRSPIAFSQVTSGFNPGRYHPVLKTKRPHNGTDFGAPKGTPVRAVASGTIVHAAWNGGHGKFIKINHADPYESSYSHLSKISVKNGQYVTKGQIIGQVGTTGLSTGPHLHFQIWKNGQFIDPMSADIPTTDKHIPDSEREEFYNKVTEILPKLEGRPIAFQLD